MKILLSWLQEFLQGELEPNALTQALTQVGIEVGSMRYLATGLDNVCVARIESFDKHPNADRLRLCKVYDGQETVDVVCGADNFVAGDLIALAQPGAHLPNGLKIKASKIRGCVSQGMICSESELGLSEDSKGIMVLPQALTPGAPLAQTLHLDDWLFDLELTPNRGDCLGIWGVAIEISASLQLPLRQPELGWDEVFAQELHVQVDDKSAAPRYVLALIEGVKVQASCDVVVQRLRHCGIRAINNVVDMTNYMMLETGQPLHAFDADKVQGYIRVRRAVSGETLLCLDGQTRSLDSSDLVIADELGPLALAGVIGGQASAVTQQTARIYLESAHFDPVCIRRTAKRLNLRTESSFRFERWVDPTSTRAVTWRTVQQFKKLQEASSSSIRLIAGYDVQSVPLEPKRLALRKSTLTRILGSTIDSAGDYLTRLGLNVTRDEQGWLVDVPLRRSDLSREIDLIEEVARLHGYQEFEPALPPIYKPPFAHHGHRMKSRIRQFCKAQGLTEVKNFSFTDESLFQLFHWPDHQPVKVQNAITQDMTHMRSMLLGSVLTSLRDNLAHQAKGACLYELSKVFCRGDQEHSPFTEYPHIAVVFNGVNQPRSWHASPRPWDYFDAKGWVEDFARLFALPSLTWSRELLPDFLHPGQGARVIQQGNLLGFVGVLHPTMCRQFDVPSTVVLELDLSRVLIEPESFAPFVPVSNFPWMERDFAFVVDRSVAAGDVLSLLKSVQSPLIADISLFDCYSGQGLEDGKKSLGVSVKFLSKERTLSEQEVDVVSQSLVARVVEAFQAQLRC